MNFPHQPDQLTAAWLTDTLCQAGVLNGANVVSFEVKPLSDTTSVIGQNSIILLVYDTPEETAPQSIFAKFALADADKRAHWRTNYSQEVRFYQQFAQRVALPTPRAYLSEFDEATGYFLLLLEDCSYGEVGDRVTGCSLEQASLIIAEIARFHATWWEHPELTQQPWPRMQDSWSNLRQERYIRLANKLDEIPAIPREPELVRAIKEHSSQFASWIKYLHQTPYTLLHNDYHVGNIIFIETNATTKLIVIDWQTLSIGRGAMDVALFLGGSCSIGDRRAHEKDLLKLYHDTLCENGVVNYTYDQCWQDYRMSIFEGFWRMVFTLENRRMFQEAQYIFHRDVIAPRYFAAAVDLKSRETLSQLGV